MIHEGGIISMETKCGSRRISFVFIALIFCIILSLTACGSSASKSTISEEAGKDNYSDNGIASFNDTHDVDVNDNDTKSSKSSSGKNAKDTVIAAPSADKLVYTASVEIETIDYANTKASLTDKVAEFDGIIGSSSETDSNSKWYYSNEEKTTGTLNLYATVRIPSANFQKFVDSLDGLGKVVSRSSDVQNISSEYHDNEASIKALELQQSRLLEMLESAESVADMIAIQDRLAEVETELNQYKTYKSEMDSNAAYSTVTISVKEVVEYTKDGKIVKTNTFWDRLGNTISDMWKSTLVFLEGFLFILIRLLPFVIFALIVTLVVIKIVKHHKNKRSTKCQVPNSVCPTPAPSELEEPYGDCDASNNIDNVDK